MNLLQLDLQFFSEEKTEKATPKKKKDTRDKGQVAKSNDVTAGFIILGIFLYLWFSGEFVIDRLINLVKHSYQEYLTWEVTEKNIEIMLIAITKEATITLAPIMIIVVVFGIFGSMIQVGVLFTAKPLKPDLKKLNPIQGAKKIFSAKALVELAKSILKITFISLVAGGIVWNKKEEVFYLSQMSVGHAAAFIGSTLITVGAAVGVTMLAISVLDYIYQKHDHEKQIKMSKKEVKDEHKNIEGDPQIKGKIKQKQREMSQRRMMEDVPNADVVITNPTHFAVALKYDKEKAEAPIVVAIGVDLVAQRIKKIALENNVVQVENKPLARGLYAQSEIGQVIPAQFFQAVAEVLAYVYKLNNQV
ncbi:flagellar biosynthesis protein FlhB (plasmid) [Rossellomorea sp. AcN35-11]|nr:flagellar biosynthesis protein FlhB [Rossellomorea aquimaris]WJV32297.1 flagellar biosynthesis protein FlhB [Rossellomorea sp. AcN35-11]